LSKKEAEKVLQKWLQLKFDGNKNLANVRE
jgi:hypothetical protein